MNSFYRLGSIKAGISSPWMMWGIANAFALFQFFLQGSVGIMSSDLRASLNLDASSISLLSSAFFYTFIVLQLPAGILLDRFGARKCAILACFTLGCGCFVFGIAPNLALAVIGRMIMGIGGAFGFVSMLTITKYWFSPSKFALMVALSEAMTMTGVALANGLLSQLTVVFGWRVSMTVCAISAWIISFLMIFILQSTTKSLSNSDSKHSPHSPENLSFAMIKPALKTLLKMPQLWISGLYAGCMNSVVTVWAALWGIPFILKSIPIDPVNTAFVISMVYVGIALASPVIGYLANRIGCSFIMTVGAFISLCLFSVVIFYPNLSLPVLAVLLFLLGMCASTYQLSFAVINGTCPIQVQAAGFGIINMLTMMGAPLLQPIIGFWLSIRQNGAVFDGFEIYTLSDFRTVLSVLPMCMFVACMTGFWLMSRDPTIHQKWRRLLKLHRV